MEVRASDGWRLGVRVHEAAGTRRAVVLLLHAMMVDGRSLERPEGAGLTSTLAAAGLEVWRADLRGRGLSGPTVAEGGRWTYDDLVRRDVPALVAAAEARGPVVVVGHSLGGHVTAASLAEGCRGVRALVMLAANVWMPSLEPSLRRRARKELALRGFAGLTRTLGRFPSRALRAGPVDEAAPYVLDLCRFWFEDRWASRDGVDWLDGLGAVRLPVLGVAGRGDRLLAHPVAMRQHLDGFPPGTVDFWEAGRGLLGVEHDPDHMGLARDPRCAPLWERIGAWIVEALERP